jgi:hypothetical protein
VYVDAAGRLWVGEDRNNRALRFDNAAAKANGAAAAGALGQPNFTTSKFSTTQNQTGNVRGIWGDGQGRIYLVDEANSRIMIYNDAAAKANGANAGNVLGQADFISCAAPAPPTAGSLSFPNSMFIHNGNNTIWVEDAVNNRLLRSDVQLSTTTAVEGEFSTERPVGYSLTQNYPNPFNPSTTIAFSLKTTEHASVTVHNLLGQQVVTLFSGVAIANIRYTLSFDASKLPSEVYLYTLRTATTSETKEMILMK